MWIFQLSGDHSVKKSGQSADYRFEISKFLQRLLRRGFGDDLASVINLKKLVWEKSRFLSK